MDQGKQVEQPKVSVIIPVYNTDAYVEEAVRSIMNQTLRDIEIILIDDGSTDNSLSVIEKLAREDSRIQYISQTNQGQSVARNTGLEKASGEYIYFMDSDDILEKEALKLCYLRCAAHSLDFVFFDAINFGDTNKAILDYNRRDLFGCKVYTGVEILNILLDAQGYRVSPWLHFIDRSFLHKGRIKFDSTFKIYEDQIFSIQLYLSANKVAYIPQFLFHRRLRKESLMMNPYMPDKVKTYFKVAQELKTMKVGMEYSKQQIINRVIGQMLNAAIYNANKLVLKDRFMVATIAFKKFCPFISWKTWIVLFFPISIRLKSFVKNIMS